VKGTDVLLCSGVYGYMYWHYTSGIMTFSADCTSGVLTDTVFPGYTEKPHVLIHNMHLFVSRLALC